MWPSSAELSTLPAELVEEALVFLGPSDLLTMERVSRRSKKLIHTRKLWRNLFAARTRDDRWSLPVAEPGSWKQTFHQYQKEMRVFQLESRTNLSGRFRWRSLRLWDQIPDPYTTTTSQAFTLGEAQSEPVRWTLLVQHIERDNKRHLGVFLQQERPAIWSLFTISIVDAAGATVAFHTSQQTFEGGQDISTNTRGWLFPVHAIESALRNDELVVEVDLTMFPNELSSLGSVYTLIGDPALSEDIRVPVINVLGDFVSSRPFTVKRFMQEYEGGPLALIKLLEDKTVNLRLQQAAAGALWNILDSSKIYLSDDLVQRMVNAACSGLHGLFCGARELARRGEADAAAAGQLAACPQCDASDQRFNDAALDGELRGFLANTFTGLMWNIPITEPYRDMLASHPAFYPSVFALLRDPVSVRTHFSGLHLISTLHHHNRLPASRVPVFRELLHSKVRGEEATDVGVLLSLRDVADFFVPLVCSRKLDCVAFGSWCIHLFYFQGAPTPVGL